MSVAELTRVGAPPWGALTDPIQRFEGAIQHEMSAGLDRPAAVRKVIEDHPDLHRAYLAAFNRKHGRTAAAEGLEPTPSASLTPATLPPRISSPAAAPEDTVRLHLTADQIKELAKIGAELNLDITREKFDSRVASGQPLKLGPDFVKVVKMGLKLAKDYKV